MLETGVVAIECVGVAFMNLAARGAMRAYIVRSTVGFPLLSCKYRGGRTRRRPDACQRQAEYMQN